MKTRFWGRLVCSFMAMCLLCTLSACVKNGSLRPDSIPEYSGAAYTIVNDNIPFFTESDMSAESYAEYSELDELGRCGAAIGCIGEDIMPTEERGDIGQIKPAGWHTVRYEFVEGNYLYNRCHLIAYQLAGENANSKNLITGTRQMNVEGMQPFENQVADYVRDTGNHVMYRVTPVYDGDNLLASGVLMEAKSVEDDGRGILFNVFCYNVQDGVEIDYLTGESSLSEGNSYTNTQIIKPGNQTAADTQSVDGEQESIASETTGTQADTEIPAAYGEEQTYILNTNTGRFHYPDCSSVDKMNEENMLEYTGSRSEIIAQGYIPCKECNP